GENWIPRQSGTQNDLSAITYGDGRFVAVGWTGTILVSTNGVDWFQRQAGTTNQNRWLNDIAYGGGMFVTVGDAGAIVTSADGENCVGRLSGTRNGFIGIAYGEGRFIAVGRGASILQSGSIFTLTITPGANTGLLSLSLEGLTGPGYTIQTSTDLISWRN